MSTIPKRCPREMGLHRPVWIKNRDMTGLSICKHVGSVAVKDGPRSGKRRDRLFLDMRYVVRGQWWKRPISGIEFSEVYDLEIGTWT